VTVWDGTTINGVQTPVILQPLSRPSATSVRGQAAGVTPDLKNFTLSFTFDDRA
jgi:hypothetical protein